VAWTEAEAQTAVAGYFQLLGAQERGESPNKAELYRKLSRRHPARSPKAFERKLQNISAILYEERLPFCDGLKPFGNYQRLLKLLVLDHLNRSPRPDVEPHELLFSRLSAIHHNGPVAVSGSGTGRFGLAIEGALGIPPNSDRSADFMGIELKTKRDGSLQTLFSRVPSRYVGFDGKRDFFEKHSYRDDARERRALYTSFSSRPDSLGFHLRVIGEAVQVCRDGEVAMEYEAERLEEALLSKHMQTAFIAVSAVREGGRERCSVDSAVFCKWPSIIRFLRLVTDGSVYLDFTMSTKADRVRDHGFLWRITSEAIPRLYLHSEAIELGD
jgi:hypothetical protein